MLTAVPLSFQQLKYNKSKHTYADQIAHCSCKKTKEITGKTKTGKIPHAYLQIDGKQTEPFMDVNILGIQLSDKLYWDRNIKLVHSNMSTKIYRVRQKFRSITVNRQSKVSDSKFVGKIYPRPYA